MKKYKVSRSLGLVANANQIVQEMRKTQLC